MEMQRNKGQWFIKVAGDSGGQTFPLPGTDNHSYATALARQWKCGRFSMPLYETRKTTEMSTDNPAASDGRPVVSRTQGLVGDRVPHHVPSLCFDICTTAPKTRPLPTVLRAHTPATSTDCPVASDGPMAIALPQSPRPLAVLRVPPPTVLINQRGPLYWPGTVSGTDWQSPPLRTPAGNPTPKTPVKGTYSGKIESRLKTQELRLSIWECDFLGINIPNID